MRLTCIHRDKYDMEVKKTLDVPFNQEQDLADSLTVEKYSHYFSNIGQILCTNPDARQNYIEFGLDKSIMVTAYNPILNILDKYYPRMISIRYRYIEKRLKIDVFIGHMHLEYVFAKDIKKICRLKNFFSFKIF